MVPGLVRLPQWNWRAEHKSGKGEGKGKSKGSIEPKGTCKGKGQLGQAKGAAKGAKGKGKAGVQAGKNGWGGNQVDAGGAGGQEGAGMAAAGADAGQQTTTAGAAGWVAGSATKDALTRMVATRSELVDPLGEGAAEAHSVARRIQETKQRLADQVPPAARRKNPSLALSSVKKLLEKASA